VPASDFQVRGGVLYPDTGGGGAAWESIYSNLMPRAGFSWQPQQKTAVRGGYGIFYDVLGPNRINANQTGYSRSTALTPSLDNGQTFIATLANPFPNGLLEPVGSDLGLMTNVGLGATFPYVGDVRTPRTHRWSLGVQRELPGYFLIEGTYVGSFSEHVPVLRELDPVPGNYFSTSPVRDDVTNNFLSQQVVNPFAGLLPGTNINGANVSRSQLLRPAPQFTSIQALETNGTSDYTSFQSRLERRMMNGFTVQLAYSWSKTMTESGYLNNFDQQLERVIGAFDRTHVFVTSGIVEMPFGRGRHWGRTWSGVTEAFAGGWQVSGLFKAQSGAPLGFGNFLFAPGSTIADVALASGRDENKWFNVDAFNRVTAQQLVSNVRTQPSRFGEVRGPGYAVLDLAFLKNVSFTERAKLQLRLEIYNAFDRANLAGPNTTPTSSAFGTITAQNGLPRQLQLAARMSF
jgi:hypothetical protein